MNFINSIGNKAKTTLLQSIASLLEKDPQNNVAKIIKLSKLLASDKESIQMINSFESSYNEIPDFKLYIDDLLTTTDHKIMNNFIVNILGNNLNHNDKHSRSPAKKSSAPRSLVINAHSDCLTNKTLSSNDFDKIIAESRKMGVFTFIIYGCDSKALNYLYDVYKKYSDSLFIPVSEECILNENSCHKILECGNVIPLFQQKNINTDLLRKNGIPSFNINYLQNLFKKSKFNNNLSGLKTFSLEFNGISQKKLMTYSISDLIKTNNI